LNKRSVSRAVLRLAIVPALLIAALVIAWQLGYFSLEQRQHLLQVATDFHRLHWSEIAFVVMYAITIAVLLPATIGTVVGGAVFGFWEGLGLAWLGALLGTCLAHALARYVARKPMRRLFGEHRLLKKLRDDSSPLDLFRLRVLPVAPFATLDYVAGVADVPLRRLVLATMLGAIPSIATYSYVGMALIRGIASGEPSGHRTLWIASGLTLGMLLLSGVPILLQRNRE